MAIDHERINDLILRPREGLNIEIKSWISPADKLGIAKIVRASFALRNRNGGFLLIGFDDKTLQPATDNRPADIRKEFHIDTVQGLISQYASEIFEIEVAFGSPDGNEYPVIVIPEGVKTPVASKADLIEDGKKLIREGDVYFRTLKANGTPSTAVARPNDWRDIVEICFENREADVGRFLRRHLSATDVSTLQQALAQIIAPQQGPPATPPTADEPLVKFEASTNIKTPNLCGEANLVLTDGENRFQKALAERGELKSEETALVNAGSWSAALVLSPPIEDPIPDKTFLNTVLSSNPELTGWPIWLDSRGFPDKTAAPRVKDNGWETLIFSAMSGWSNHIDFYRFDPVGKFYLRRNFQDDATNKVKSKTVLDPIIVVLRVAEAIAVGLSIAKAIGRGDENHQLTFAFKWQGLSMRTLSSWANPLTSILAGTAYDDEACSCVELPADTASTSIGPIVDKATRNLFALFDGYRMRPDAIEYWVQRLLERKL